MSAPTEIITEELKDRNPAIAQWLIDRVRPPRRSDYSQSAGDVQLNTAENIVALSADIASAASKGEISLQQAKAFQEVFSRHAEFKRVEELANLRSEVEKL